MSNRINVVSVILTDRERAALEELARQNEMTAEKMMVLALRQYQLVAKGHAKLVFPPSGKKASEVFAVQSTDSIT